MFFTERSLPRSPAAAQKEKLKQDAAALTSGGRRNQAQSGFLAEEEHGDVVNLGCRSIPAHSGVFERGRSPERAAAAEDIDVVSSGGRRIPAHAGVLAAASPVLERELRRKPEVVRMRGLPDGAVAAFVGLLYSGDSRCNAKELEAKIGQFGMHLLVLSHAYSVPWLKSACESSLAARLTPGTAVDMLVLAELCDAPRLHVRCMRFVAKNFGAVQRTEGWAFLQENDPWLELDILKFQQEYDQRRRRWRRRKSEEGVYKELSQAMECLHHICTEGCTEVGPMGQALPPSPCARFAMCHGLQLLIRHFASCHQKGCSKCRRMWQLLRLHAALCANEDNCKVPLCKQFKQKTKGGQAAAADEEKWRLLAWKVTVAGAMSSLAMRRTVVADSSRPEIPAC